METPGEEYEGEIWGEIVQSKFSLASLYNKLGEVQGPKNEANRRQYFLSAERIAQEALMQGKGLEGLVGMNECRLMCRILLNKLLSMRLGNNVDFATEIYNNVNSRIRENRIWRNAVEAHLTLSTALLILYMNDTDSVHLSEALSHSLRCIRKVDDDNNGNDDILDLEIGDAGIYHLPRYDDIKKFAIYTSGVSLFRLPFDFLENQAGCSEVDRVVMLKSIINICQTSEMLSTEDELKLLIYAVVSLEYLKINNPEEINMEKLDDIIKKGEKLLQSSNFRSPYDPTIEREKNRSLFSLKGGSKTYQRDYNYIMKLIGVSHYLIALHLIVKEIRRNSVSITSHIQRAKDYLSKAETLDDIDVIWSMAGAWYLQIVHMDHIKVKLADEAPEGDIEYSSFTLHRNENIRALIGYFEGYLEISQNYLKTVARDHTGENLKLAVIRAKFYLLEIYALDEVVDSYRSRLIGLISETLEEFNSLSEEVKSSKFGRRARYSLALAFMSLERREEAMKELKMILSDVSFDADAYEWANAHRLIGILMIEWEGGDSTENIIKSILHFKFSLKFFTVDNYPYFYGSIHMNIIQGIIKLIATEDESESGAIAMYEGISYDLMKYFRVVFLSFKAYSVEWLRSQLLIANMYFHIHSDYRRDNIPLAIEHLKLIQRCFQDIPDEVQTPTLQIIKRNSMLLLGECLFLNQTSAGEVEEAYHTIHEALTLNNDTSGGKAPNVEIEEFDVGSKFNLEYIQFLEGVSHSTRAHPYGLDIEISFFRLNRYPCRDQGSATSPHCLDIFSVIHGAFLMGKCLYEQGNYRGAYIYFIEVVLDIAYFAGLKGRYMATKMQREYHDMYYLATTSVPFNRIIRSKRRLVDECFETFISLYVEEYIYGRNAEDIQQNCIVLFEYIEMYKLIVSGNAESWINYSKIKCNWLEKLKSAKNCENQNLDLADLDNTSEVCENWVLQLYFSFSLGKLIMLEMKFNKEDYELCIPKYAEIDLSELFAPIRRGRNQDGRLRIGENVNDVRLLNKRNLYHMLISKVNEATIRKLIPDHYRNGKIFLIPHSFFSRLDWEAVFSGTVSKKSSDVHYYYSFCELLKNSTGKNKCGDDWISVFNIQ